jgi:hypothetical protein
MGATLDTVIERVRQLPEEHQESLARFILFEIEEDEKWLRTTADNEAKLQSLIDAVVRADNTGAS